MGYVSTACVLEISIKFACKILSYVNRFHCCVYLECQLMNKYLFCIRCFLFVTSVTHISPNPHLHSCLYHVGQSDRYRVLFRDFLLFVLILPGEEYILDYTFAVNIFVKRNLWWRHSLKIILEFLKYLQNSRLIFRVYTTEFWQQTTKKANLNSRFT